jgi:hypothetical protein
VVSFQRRLDQGYHAWCAWAESSGLNPQATLDLLKYNQTLTNG